MLKEHWSFTCQCVRCSDPSDLGTYSSAIRCIKCLEATLASTTSTETGSEDAAVGLLLPEGSAASEKWSCTRCGFDLEVRKVEALIEEGLRIIRLIYRITLAETLCIYNHVASL